MYFNYTRESIEGVKVHLNALDLAKDLAVKFYMASSEMEKENLLQPARECLSIAASFQNAAEKMLQWKYKAQYAHNYMEMMRAGVTGREGC